MSIFKKINKKPPIFTLSFKQLLRDPRLFVALGFGSGLSPYAPGTMGTLAALFLYPLMALTSGKTYLGLWLLTCMIAIYLADYAEHKIGIHDYSGIVCDEIVGFWLSLWLIPSGFMWIIAAFVLFRLFDILKPWPIHLLQNLPGGWGCVLDDAAAGFAAWLVLQVTHFAITQ